MPDTRQRLGLLSTILRAACEDQLIASNPCTSRAIRLPRVTRKQIEVWSPEVRERVRGGLPERLAALVEAGAGLGLRQSELFALSLEEVAFLERVVHVNMQVKLVSGRQVLAPPKMGKTRVVPLAAQVGEMLSAHIAQFPAVPVSLPWHEPGTRHHGRPRTVTLLFTTPDGRSLNRNHFNQGVWRPAVRAAGLADDRVNGVHMLRHLFASTLVSRGVDPRTVAEYLGHTDGGVLVLKTYSHLMPDAEDRARKAIEAALTAEQSNIVASHATEE